MRSRICLTLAWLVLLGALAIGNPWLPTRPATDSAPALLPSEAAGSLAPAGGSPPAAPPRAGVDDAAVANRSDTDEPSASPAGEAGEPVVESPPSTGN